MQKSHYGTGLVFFAPPEIHQVVQEKKLVKEAGIQLSNDELQKLASTLFIQRMRLA